ncbi:hypothetical protein LPB406_11030 [Streptococcus sp. LPB0406]|nr:hypothetical protein [Streptococcus sp. LPB0406]
MEDCHSTDNFTGVFRDQSNASSQGLFFRNDDVTINGRRCINSKAIIGADRRDNDIRSHWDQGGFNGMIVDTIKGVGTGDHDNADKVTFVGDRFNFTHSYNYDQATGSNPYGWRITTWGGTTIAHTVPTEGTPTYKLVTSYSLIMETTVCG